MPRGLSWARTHAEVDRQTHRGIGAPQWRAPNPRRCWATPVSRAETGGPCYPRTMSGEFDFSLILIELGAVVLGLALLTRLANRFAFSAIPLYLLAGLALGKGGLIPLMIDDNFVRMGSEIGVLLLLFMLGLEYTGEQLRRELRSGLPAGLVDFALNFPPGFLVGLLLGWDPLGCGTSRRRDLHLVFGRRCRRAHGSRPHVESRDARGVSILVIEDLAMALVRAARRRAAHRPGLDAAWRSLDCCRAGGRGRCLCLSPCATAGR